MAAATRPAGRVSRAANREVDRDTKYFDRAFTITTRSAHHDTFVIERTYNYPHERVYAAFADQGAKARWFVGPDNWEKSNHQLDFRVGGKESVSGGSPGDPIHYYNATYQDIVPNERIVSTYDMLMDDKRISELLNNLDAYLARQPAN